MNTLESIGIIHLKGNKKAFVVDPYGRFNSDFDNKTASVDGVECSIKVKPEGGFDFFPIEGDT